jgi:hypothetical protein
MRARMASGFGEIIPRSFLIHSFTTHSFISLDHVIHPYLFSMSLKTPSVSHRNKHAYKGIVTIAFYPPNCISSLSLSPPSIP